MLREDLIVTAELANITLSDADMGRFSDQVGKMLDFFAKMDEIDVSALEPTTHALLANNRVREDHPAPFNNRTNNSLVENAPDSEGDFVSIPNVL
jgi:aspartyl-tRNA(Asn)/glutamyl-tRNA(Gln) amidotransferase subunit C